MMCGCNGVACCRVEKDHARGGDGQRGDRDGDAGQAEAVVARKWITQNS